MNIVTKEIPKCKNCGHEMHIVGIQEYPEKYNLLPRIEIECPNEGICFMYGQTFTTTSYKSVDVEQYRREDNRS